MRKTFGGSKKSRRLRNRRKAKTRRRAEKKAENRIIIESSGSSEPWIKSESSISSEPDTRPLDELHNNPLFRQIMPDPELSEYISDFNLTPGKKYIVNNESAVLTFEEVVRDGGGLHYVFSIPYPDGSTSEVIYYNTERFPITIRNA